MQRSNRVDIYADTDDTGVIGANIEPFAGDVAREYAKQAKASAEAALASENASDESEAAAKASENAAAVSEAAAKASEEAAAASEQAAKISETNAKASETAAAASAQDAHNVAEAVGNPVTDVTEVNGKVTVTKSNGDKNEFFAGLNMLQRNKAYAVGDIAYSPNLKSYEYLECITAGTTGDTEPDFSESQTGGVISDGTAQFQIVDQKQDGTDIDALKSELEAVKSSLAAVQTAISDAENFTIIYPNGGTAAKPASVKTDTEYTMNNPFPGYHVSVITQCYINSKWAAPNPVMSGYGVWASQVLPADTIHVRVGNAAIIGTKNNTGHVFGDIKDITTAPCRVLVYKLGKIGE